MAVSTASVVCIPGLHGGSGSTRCRHPREEGWGVRGVTAACCFTLQRTTRRFALRRPLVLPETRTSPLPLNTRRGTAPRQVQDPSPYITLQAAKRSLSALPVSIYNFTWPGVTNHQEEAQAHHTFPRHRPAPRRRAVPLLATQRAQEPAHPRCSHTQPAPTPHAWFR